MSINSSSFFVVSPRREGSFKEATYEPRGSKEKVRIRRRVEEFKEKRALKQELADYDYDLND